MLDTIFALASARGKAGVAVVRISGPQAHAALDLMTTRPEARKASLRKLHWQGLLLDEALVLLFNHGASFTGEDSVELHLHGGRAVVAAVLVALAQIPGVRQAEAGEFTRRALDNGCLDLTQVEGLADLIDAETEAQRVQSLRVLSGAIGARVEAWRKDIIRAAALLEATIDFADEDVPFDVMPEVIEILDRLIENLQAEANGVKLSERIRDGFEVAIVGRPNAGKSTLLNQLAGRMAAITSEIAGTTRDVIEVRMDLAGLPVTFLDTAGIRKTDDRLEALGVDIAVTRAKAADIRLFLLETPSDELELESSPGDFWLIGKADQIGGIPMVSGLYPVSGLTGQGIPELLEGLTQELSLRTMGASVLTRERHRVAVVQALGALQLVKQECAGNAPVVELAAEELRSASRALEVLLGHIDVETLLGEIFASFCIGK